MLLEGIVRGDGKKTFRSLVGELGFPESTARRIVLTLERRGLVTRSARGVYAAGAALVDLAVNVDLQAILRRSGRPVLRSLAAEFLATAHLAVLEADMATYLVREGSGLGLFTREGSQLEAYCSGVGKVLISSLPAQKRETYLSNGVFVALTPHTVTDPDELRARLKNVAEHGFAIDDEEVAEGLYCIAVPIRGRAQTAYAAISLSGPKDQLGGRPFGPVIAALQKAASEIERASGLTGNVTAVMAR
jgi:IclR family acetate operon transcriptional repressor